jgi:hypothetical protein
MPDGTAAAEAAGRVKGAAVRPFLAWYERTWPAPRLARLAEPIPPPLRAGLAPEEPALGIIASAWYPAPVVNALLDRILADHPASEHDRIAREGGRAIIEATLTGVYRWLFETMMTPERYARNAQKLFSRYYEPGTMTKSWLAETGHLTVVTGWTGHHPLMCRFLVHTAEYVYTALGCRDVRVKRTACVHDGNPDCRFEANWAG